MTWQLDGSGLLVKRHRGMTLPQRTSFGTVRDAFEWEGASLSRKIRRECRGDNSNVDAGRRAVRGAMALRLSRRAKRHAKAAARRLDTLLVVRRRHGVAIITLTPEALRAYHRTTINPERLDP
jgi:hypothetical protein